MANQAMAPLPRVLGLRREARLGRRRPRRQARGLDPPRRPALALARARRPIGPAGPSKQPLFTSILIPGEEWQSVGPASADGPGRERARRDLLRRGLGSRPLVPGRAAIVVPGRPAAPCAVSPSAPTAGSTPPTAARKRIVSLGPDGRETVVASGLAAHDLAVTHDGRIYATEPTTGKVWQVAKGKATVVDEGVAEPGGIALTPDQSLLLVADAQGPVRLLVPDRTRRLPQPRSSPTSTCTWPRATPRAAPPAWRWTRTGTCTSRPASGSRSATRRVGSTASWPVRGRGRSAGSPLRGPSETCSTWWRATASTRGRPAPRASFLRAAAQAGGAEL